MKYDGLNIVETTVKENKTPSVKRKRFKTPRFLLQIVVGSLIVLAAFLGRISDIPILSKISQAVKTAITYDMGGETDFGGGDLREALRSIFNKANNP